jgi:capsular exopolysaccharide synthesis family protein
MSQAAAAVMPLEISSPKLVLNIAVGTFLGLLLSLGVALALELVNTRIRTPGDLTRHLHLSILGTVPDIDDEEIVIERIETAVIDAPHSMVAEAFRQIRTNLFFAAPAERQRTLLLTSPSSEDGKTSVAINLAASLASTGRRVLLVDANLRRPALHALFNGSNDRGLSHVLIGQARWQEVVSKTSLANLDYLAAGPTPPNPAELLGGSYMRTFLAETAAEYDQVLFDGPPVLLVSDATVISAMVDGVVLVFRAKANSRGVAARSRDLLVRVNAHILGAVLNAAQAQRGGYFREQLRNFYEYQQESLEAERARRALPKGKDRAKKRKGKDKGKDIEDDENADEPGTSTAQDEPPVSGDSPN